MFNECTANKRGLLRERERWREIGKDRDWERDRERNREPKVTNFYRVRASAVSNHLAKPASNSVHLFGWNFGHKQSRTDTHRDTQKKNCSENITPPRFGGVKIDFQRAYRVRMECMCRNTLLVLMLK